MSPRELLFKLPTDYSEEYLKEKICQIVKVKEFTYQVENKSLDARNKDSIYWLVKVAVFLPIAGESISQAPPTLHISYLPRKEKVIIVGSGPAGFFAALVLQKAGFKTTIIERGKDVDKRAQAIELFETSGNFDPTANYAFGEGGAGTFSDGKLTSRSKHISREKQFILDCYIQAGAPKEIAYLAHPHLGSDNLKLIVRNLRQEYLSLGGCILFETVLTDIKIRHNKVVEAITSHGLLEVDFIIMASGHSAYDTFRMLISHGVAFKAKNFALGHRVEHSQNSINLAQWGVEKLKGVTAAEYRLTSNVPGQLGVYTFCMCPGGVIVPANAYEKMSVVNGMSYYQRDGKYANSACVTGLNLETLGGISSPLEILDWVENLERSFYEFTNGYKIPVCKISDYMRENMTSFSGETSFPLGVVDAPIWKLIPIKLSQSIRSGIMDFSRKLVGFESGNIMGLESKTSAPIQVIRDSGYRCLGFDNLFVVGEGSGHSGGIISSAADGIKVALNLI